MNLATAIKGMLDAQDRLRTPRGTSDPDEISEQMQRLAQYTGAVENYLAEYERDYEIELGRKLHQYIVTEGTNATTADKRVRIDLAEQKANIAYLTRIVSSAWKQVSTSQSRWNHLQTDKNRGKIIT